MRGRERVPCAYTRSHPKPCPLPCHPASCSGEQTRLSEGRYQSTRGDEGGPGGPEETNRLESHYQGFYFCLPVKPCVSHGGFSAKGSGGTESGLGQ